MDDKGKKTPFRTAKSWFEKKFYRAKFIRLVVVPSGLIGSVIGIIDLAGFFSKILHHDPDDRTVLAFMVFFCFVTLSLVIIWFDGHVKFRISEAVDITTGNLVLKYEGDLSNRKQIAGLIASANRSIIEHYREVMFKYEGRKTNEEQKGKSNDLHKEDIDRNYIFNPIFQEIKRVTNHLLNAEGANFRFTIKIRNPDHKLEPIYRSEKIQELPFETEKNLLFEYFKSSKGPMGNRPHQDLLLEDIPALPKMVLAELVNKFGLPGPQLIEMISNMVKRASESGYTSLYAVPINIFVPMKKEGQSLIEETKVLIGFFSLDAQVPKHFNVLEEHRQIDPECGILNFYYSVGIMLGCLVYQLNLGNVKGFLSGLAPDDA